MNKVVFFPEYVQMSGNHHMITKELMFEKELMQLCKT